MSFSTTKRRKAGQGEDSRTMICTAPEEYVRVIRASAQMAGVSCSDFLLQGAARLAVEQGTVVIPDDFAVIGGL